MPYSENVLKFKELQKQHKALVEQRKQILEDFYPDIKKAILSKMDWDDLKLQSYDYNLGDIMIAVENPNEKEDHRYVFMVKLLENDAFYLDLQFREVFKY